MPYGPPRPGVPTAVPRQTRYAYHRPPREAAGSRVGRYVLDGELGHGGMGVVYSAMDVKLGRRAAVKMLRTGLPASRALSHGAERLLREAQALARIDHPNIVSLYDVGEAGGRVYLAMEELHGMSLKAWIDARPRGWREVLPVFLQAGRGLAAAHRAGVMHRDFKPHNVQIEPDGRVVVLDFGLALATPSERTPSSSPPHISLHSRLTDLGVVLGTAGYMSPEQLMRNASGPGSDQFAFCVCLYEALFGVRPYSGDSGLEIARSFREGVVNKPRRNRVPRRIRAAVLRGLEIDPEDRWPSIHALLAELERDPQQRLRGISRTAVLVGCAWAGAYGVMWAQAALTVPTATASMCLTGTAPTGTAPTGTARD